MPDGSATAHIFQPKLLTVAAEGYSRDTFRRDAIAGLTVAIVALPLSMAIAVGSGVSPERGLYAAIVGGFIVSALGGSRFQIGGPAGAFITLVAVAMAKYGLDGVLLAVMMSGIFMVLIGISGLGALIRYIPQAVTVGFTGGIAVTILASQLRDLGGLTLAGQEPSHLIPKLFALAGALPSLNPSALAAGAGSAALIFALQRWRPQWPAMLIAVTGVALVALGMHLPVATIGSKFGGIPNGLPVPALPVVTWPRLLEMLPTALSFTLLGSVESLLSAKIADAMTQRKHRYNMELLAQGIANVVTAVFGGICVTGTIARTATNIRAGGRTPVAGMLHAVFLLAFMVVAAPLANFIPLAALAGVLLVVCWKMIETDEILHMLRRWPTAIVLVVTFGLTLIEDLTVGIVAGCATAALIAACDRYTNRKRV